MADTAARLSAREIRNYLIQHPDLLDGPVIAPDGEAVTGIGIGSAGIVLMTGEAVADAD